MIMLAGRMLAPSAIVDQASATLMVFAFGFGTMTALEVLAPRGKATSLRGRVPGFVFWGLWTLSTALIYAGFNWLWARIGMAPLFALPLQFEWLGIGAVVAAPVAGAVVGDFFFYWFHRAQHVWLWPFHSVHHSVTDLNAVNTYHHFSEAFFQSVMITLPMSLISADTGPTIPLMAVLLYLHGSSIHASTRLHLGPMRSVLVDNRFHRIHHSREERHFDKNFGAFTTLWDRLFGTAHFPSADEWPETGIAEVEQPRTVREWADLPLRYRRAVRASQSATVKNEASTAIGRTI